MKKFEWNNYFEENRNKYNLKISSNKPLVIFLDGKNVTSSLKHSLIAENQGSFNDVLEQTCKYFVNQFNCIAITGADEVSFIFEDSNEIKKLVSEKKYKAQDIASIFSQYFFEQFNNQYKMEKIYWHCKCTNIPKGKIKSYIKYRSTGIFELQLTYFLKKNKIENAGKIPLNEKIQKYNEILGEEKNQIIDKGKLYIKKGQIDLESFLEGKIIEIVQTKRENFDTVLDITNF